MRSPRIIPVPVYRILERLDRYLADRDYENAERLLGYWLLEAQAGNDIRGKLSLLNEQIGLYRKLNRESECMTAIISALHLAAMLQPDDGLLIGTTYLNAATGYNAFGRAEQALTLYSQAQQIFESNPAKAGDRMAGLYNNMALTLVALKRYDEAESLFRKALSILDEQGQAEPDMAITFLNLADLVCARDGSEAGEETIEEYLLQAEKLLLGGCIRRDSYYLYVCEKCAEVFGYYGHFLTKQELLKRAAGAAGEKGEGCDEGT